MSHCRLLPQEVRESKYPAIIRLWERAWPEMTPFLSLDKEIRSLISTTNAVESLNARLRRAANASKHFPTGTAALKRLYLAVLSLDPNGTARVRWSNKWMSRPEARYRDCSRPVSPGRSPNPPCASQRNGLSTIGSVRLGWSAGGRGWGSSRPGTGSG